MVTGRDVLRERIGVLVMEAAQGNTESRHRVTGALYMLGLIYGIESSNALENFDSFIDLLPEDADIEIPVEDRCFDCYYTRLCAASCSSNEAMREALILEANAYCPEDYKEDFREPLSVRLTNADVEKDRRELIK